jgi:hypothetical protein
VNRLGTVLLFAATCAGAFAQQPAKPILYNYLEGDGGIELDRQIKDAYARSYSIVDVGKADGYTEPEAVGGEMPKAPVNGLGQSIGGYVLVAYIVSAEGLVADPVVLRMTHPDLTRVALDAMLHWRFKPGTLKGAAVATTAAQEFNFGPRDISNGYEPAHVEIGQPRDVVLKRMPPSDVAAAYLNRIEEVAHHFFVGDTKPETLHIVIVTRPGLRARVWLVSSIRPGDSPELDPLRKLIAAVPPLEAHEGPFILAVTGRIAGGDSREPVDDRDTRFPIPEDWRALVKGLKDPPPFSSDAFLDLLWPDSN